MRNGISSRAHHFASSSWFLLPLLALWNSNFKMMNETNDVVTCIWLSYSRRSRKEMMWVSSKWVVCWVRREFSNEVINFIICRYHGIKLIEWRWYWRFAAVHHTLAELLIIFSSEFAGTYTWFYSVANQLLRFIEDMLSLVTNIGRERSVAVRTVGLV